MICRMCEAALDQTMNKARKRVEKSGTLDRHLEINRAENSGVLIGEDDSGFLGETARQI
ncbi:hypothetical protein PROFUN_10595 [Planoprotostelium fungivorum]|uniref:Uncharacterized protein n=1 Tax=Planoprotostelium fungivorum TaxID=1890364 RepID=A0A2P6ND07_9EUKA|nr:hypothetical protein PROFUN_10595 [Planoprotostelium fungivorum]